ncbi:alpha/beta fold hydrolase [Desulfitobacterium sp. PCE1]|uniref:alpha/beta fold hydrolase n=1 Tax=Desulfitobacterium sp. PCE1 TaxID=146907 RepID=UPI00036482D6|nr:alpha/beta hydrolase [Desulfitobacterium sp. PCE1]
MPIVTLSDGKLHYLDRGTGKPLVFIHGLGANLSFHDPQIEVFSRTHRVICPELRGNARSSKLTGPIHKILDIQCQDVAALMEHLGIERSVLAGTSYGGVLCFNFVLRYPEKVSGLIIGDALGDTQISSFREALLMFVQYIGLWGLYLPKPLLISMVKYQYKQWPYARDHVVNFVRGMRRTEFLLQLLAMNRIDFSPYLKQVSCPALGIVGEQNKVGVGWMKSAMKEIPHSSLEIVPHSLDPTNLCQPERYNYLVKEFLERLNYI